MIGTNAGKTYVSLGLPVRHNPTLSMVPILVRLPYHEFPHAKPTFQKLDTAGAESMPPELECVYAPMILV
jgi:hypothetical protein